MLKEAIVRIVCVKEIDRTVRAAHENATTLRKSSLTWVTILHLPPSTSMPTYQANNQRRSLASVIQASRSRTPSSHPNGHSQAEQMEATSSLSSQRLRTARTSKSLLLRQLWQRTVPWRWKIGRGRCRRAHQPEPPKSSSSRNKSSRLIRAGDGTQLRGKDQQLMSTHFQNNSSSRKRMMIRHQLLVETPGKRLIISAC